MIAINSVTLPAPTEFGVTYQEALGQKQLNALGGVVRDVLGRKRRVHIGYKRLRGEDAAALFKLLESERELTLNCPALSGDVALVCYVVSMQGSLFRREEGLNQWADVSIVLEEV